MKKDIERMHQNLGHPSVQHMERLFREAKVTDEAMEALKHLSCDACCRLKQPPARRQAAITHAEMFNDVVSMDVNFWKLKERDSTEKNTLTEFQIRHLRRRGGLSRAVGFVGLVRRNVSEWVL